ANNRSTPTKSGNGDGNNDGGKDDDGGDDVEGYSGEGNKQQST
ncbi:hypothetical protein A2U01_0115119, partial [Trifolium medium]|nr:hypothetical protein [Trifolium medium]